MISSTEDTAIVETCRIFLDVVKDGKDITPLRWEYYNSEIPKFYNSVPSNCRITKMRYSDISTVQREMLFGKIKLSNESNSTDFSSEPLFLVKLHEVRNIETDCQKIVILEKLSFLQKNYKTLPKDTLFLAVMGFATTKVLEFIDMFLRNYQKTQVYILSDFDLGGIRFAQHIISNYRNAIHLGLRSNDIENCTIHIPLSERDKHGLPLTINEPFKHYAKVMLINNMKCHLDTCKNFVKILTERLHDDNKIFIPQEKLMPEEVIDIEMYEQDPKNKHFKTVHGINVYNDGLTTLDNEDWLTEDLVDIGLKFVFEESAGQNCHILSASEYTMAIIHNQGLLEETKRNI